MIDVEILWINNIYIYICCVYIRIYIYWFSNSTLLSELVKLSLQGRKIEIWKELLLNQQVGKNRRDSSASRKTPGSNPLILFVHKQQHEFLIIFALQKVDWKHCAWLVNHPTICRTSDTTSCTFTAHACPSDQKGNDLICSFKARKPKLPVNHWPKKTWASEPSPSNAISEAANPNTD